MSANGVSLETSQVRLIHQPTKLHHILTTPVLLPYPSRKFATTAHRNCISCVVFCAALNYALRFRHPSAQCTMGSSFGLEK